MAVKWWTHFFEQQNDKMNHFTIFIHPFGLITFVKSGRAAQLDHFIPAHVSGGLNWKLAAGLAEVSGALAL